MQKHDKMVALAKEKSAEMTETAITAIETMYPVYREAQTSVRM